MSGVIEPLVQACRAEREKLRHPLKMIEADQREGHAGHRTGYITATASVMACKQRSLAELEGSEPCLCSFAAGGGTLRAKPDHRGQSIRSKSRGNVVQIANYCDDDPLIYRWTGLWGSAADRPRKAHAARTKEFESKRCSAAILSSSLASSMPNSNAPGLKLAPALIIKGPLGPSIFIGFMQVQAPSG